MVGYIASLRQGPLRIPQVDTSWLNGLEESIGGAIDQYGDTKLAREALTQSASLAPTAPQQGGFFGNLIGGGRQGVAPQAGPSMSRTAPVGRVDRGPAQGSTFEPFINTVRAGGVTNPNALAAIAATGKAESGWSPANANRSWSDPSVSGQPGTAGGVMSWRAERLQNLYNYARSKGEQPGNISPETQAEFFLREDPELIARLNQAQSPQEAADIMAGAWRFAGYDQQGGEAARRRAMAQNYYSQFAGAEMGDTSGTETAYVDPTVVNASNVSQRPTAQPQGLPVNQVADASGSIIAPGITPVQRGSVDPDLLARMIGNPRLRDMGIALWKQNAGQAGAEPWQFVTLPDGTLARANQQTGAVERLGNFAKPQDPRGLVNAGDGQLYDPNTKEWISAPNSGQKKPDIVELFDEQTGQPYKARWNAETQTFDRVGGIKAPSGTSLSVGPDGQVSFQQGSGTKFTEAQSKDNVFSTRARGALPTADQYADYLADYGNALLDRDPTGLVRGNLQNPDYQVARTAADEFLQAILRKDTGAAITEQEQELYGRTYFPVPGDGPEVRAYKKEARQRAVAAIEAGMSPAQIVAQERALAKTAGVDLGSGKKNEANKPVSEMTDEELEAIVNGD